MIEYVTQEKFFNIEKKLQKLEKRYCNLEKEFKNSLNYIDHKYALHITMISTFINATNKKLELKHKDILPFLPNNCTKEIKELISFYFK